MFLIFWVRQRKIICYSCFWSHCIDINKAILKNHDIVIDIFKDNLENIDININKDYLENIDIDKDILENIDIYKGILENIDINIDIDKVTLRKNTIFSSRF